MRKLEYLSWSAHWRQIRGKTWLIRFDSLILCILLPVSMMETSREHVEGGEMEFIEGTVGKLSKFRS